MNEEEKKAVQDSKNIINELNNHKDKDFIGRMYYKNKPIEEILAILLKLIEKLRERLKLMDDYNNWVQVAIDRGIELEKLQKENEELKKRISSLEDGLAKLQNELDKLQKKYETDTHILQDQLDLANAKRVEVEKENLAQKAVIYEDCILNQKNKR